MKLTNEFTVGAGADEVWRTLLDMEGVAGCLPGATIEPAGEEDTYNGSMRLKIGPMTVTYRGTATLSEVDDESRRAVISLRAREEKGQGTAMATITNRVEPSDAGTTVRAETDLHITGAQARFGRGVMEDVAARVLDDFSGCLERQIAGPDEEAGDSPPAPASGPDSLDVGKAVAGTSAARSVRVAAPLLLALLLLALVVRRRR